MPDTSNFTPSAAIVTASDSGIGKATAVALARAGMDVGRVRAAATSSRGSSWR